MFHGNDISPIQSQAIVKSSAASDSSQIQKEANKIIVESVN